MPTFRDVPCLYCGDTFTWQNDSAPDRDPRICCWRCEEKALELGTTKTCRICDKAFVEHHTGALRVALKTCFECSFWIEHITRPDENRIISISPRDGNRLHNIAGHWGIKIGDSRFLGYGGVRFRVTFTNGEVKFTNNLWFQGVIPERFHQYLPVNVIELTSSFPNSILHASDR